MDGGNPEQPRNPSRSSAVMPTAIPMMLPPPLGQFGNMGRNTFQDTGFRNLDFSVAKNFHFGETHAAAVPRGILQHSQPSQLRQSVRRTERIRLERSVGAPFGCACATPDVAAANPVIGSGGSRAVQLAESSFSKLRLARRISGPDAIPSGLFYMNPLVASEK